MGAGAPWRAPCDTLRSRARTRVSSDARPAPPGPVNTHRPRTGVPLGRRNIRGPQRLTGVTLNVTLNGAVTGAAHASSAGAHAHADVLVGAHPRSLGPPCRGVHRRRRRPRRRMEPKFSAARSANMNQPLRAPEPSPRPMPVRHRRRDGSRDGLARWPGTMATSTKTIRVRRQRLLAIVLELGEDRQLPRTAGGQRRMRHGWVSTSAILMTRALAHVANTTRAESHRFISADGAGFTNFLDRFGA
jgi:hypothetical protein